MAFAAGPAGLLVGPAFSPAAPSLLRPWTSASPPQFPAPLTIPAAVAHRFVFAVPRTELAVSGDGDGGGGSSPPVSVVALVGDGSLSPLKAAPWSEVMLHTATRMKWVNEGFEMRVFTDKDIADGNGAELAGLSYESSRAELMVVVAVTNQESVDWIQANCKNVPNVVCFDSSPALDNKLGGSFVNTSVGGSLLGKLVASLQLEKKSESLEVVSTVTEAWGRHNADDIRFCLLVIINAYIRPVPILKNLRAKGPDTLSCMVSNCGKEVLNCLLDPNCRKALQCLNNCSPTDQVCSYRCIASYESPYLEAFSLCVLQKNNCLGLDANIPTKPYVPPMLKFRGESLTHEVAEDLFVGWLGQLQWSWRVVAGQNPAYDQFPCQYQLFYRGKARGSFWYEPVFQVRTLDGKMVWRRRRYRVKRDKVPGTFYFTVLDNGVVSREFWTIVDVADDLSWGLFHYSGAASAAGQCYTGAVLGSPDGKHPSEKGGERLALALEKCGIKEWELYTVDNSSCSNPPLGIPEGSGLHARIKICYVIMNERSVSVDDDLNEAARQVEEMKLQTERLDPEFLKHYAIVDREADFENALQNGKTSPTGLISVKSKKSSSEKHARQKDKRKRNERKDANGSKSKSNKKRKS